MEQIIKKGSKWTCIEDVLIGYKLKIFNASEVYESLKDGQLIDNKGKARYVCSTWFKNFLQNEVPRKTKSEDIKPQNLLEDKVGVKGLISDDTLPAYKKADLDESLKNWVDKVIGNSTRGLVSGTTPPDLDKEAFKMAGNLTSTPKQWCFDNSSFARDASKIVMLNLKKEVVEGLNEGKPAGTNEFQSALNLESNISWNTAPKKLTPELLEESDAKEWLKYCEEYSKKIIPETTKEDRQKLYDTKNNWWDNFYGDREGVGYLPKPSKIIQFPDKKAEQDQSKAGQGIGNGRVILTAEGLKPIEGEKSDAEYWTNYWKDLSKKSQDKKQGVKNDSSIQSALEESNRSKYGQKEFDLISEQYRISEHDGHVWTGTNAIKYISRYKRIGSSKSGNLSDLLKAQDYLERMIEAHRQFHPQSEELKEFK